jgi:hypothetical protein
MTPSQEDGLIVQLTTTMTPCDLEQNFERSLLPPITNPKVEPKLPTSQVKLLAFLTYDKNVVENKCENYHVIYRMHVMCKMKGLLLILYH